MPDFANRPLWGVMQQYVNHSINEMYTALKVNPEGRIVPTVVFRQIPFTTDALKFPNNSPATDVAASNFGVDAVSGGAQTAFVAPPEDNTIATTKFLDLPRWYVSSTMVKRVHVGRSNATRTNFVHVYGTSTNLANQGIPTQYQMLNNPPVRDDVDIFRSGCRTHLSHVDCWVDDTVGKVPGKWMALIADWMMGSHLTLNGMVDLYGIQAPIAEGDNVVFDGVVYHIMQVDHYASIDPQSGMKHFGTTLQLTNGMRDLESAKAAFNATDISNGLQPIYPGFKASDNTQYDPGLTLEGDRTSGGSTILDPQQDPDRDSLSDLSFEDAGEDIFQPNELQGDETEAEKTVRVDKELEDLL